MRVGVEAEAPMDVAEFHASPGVEDWRILGNGAHCRYRTASLAAGVAWVSELVGEIGGTSTHPDVDLRTASVTIRLPAHPETDRFVDDDDLATAQRIQAHARAAGLVPDPGTLRQIQIAVAHAPDVDVRPFWQTVLGHVPIGEEDSADPESRLPPTWFHEIRDRPAGRGRTHIDIYVPADQAEAIVEEAVASGGRIADDSHAPSWWTLASPDNHGVDIAPWPDRG